MAPESGAGGSTLVGVGVVAVSLGHDVGSVAHIITEDPDRFKQPDLTGVPAEGIPGALLGEGDEEGGGLEEEVHGGVPC